MTHLLTLSIGPVQDFIAAARRTRDLWFGSHLLSEISKAVARSLREQNAQLIFPAIEMDDAASLKPESSLKVANVILATLPDGVDVSTVVDRAKIAGKQCWRQFADKAVKLVDGHVRKATWANQIDDVIEIYAAWVPFTEATYSQDRQRLNRLMAGRKNARDFDAAKGEAGVPKSSLDGQRESVLDIEGKLAHAQKMKLRLSDGEQLDAVALVKRLGGGKATYPSVARIAADPYLRGKSDADLEPLRKACDSLGTDIVHGVSDSQYDHFPYEGSVVYPERIANLAGESGTAPAKFADLRKALSGLKGEPNPYLAVLVADGDRVGKALSEKKSPKEHRDFSEALAGFSEGVEAIVEKYQGVLVYAGGDDVLAFLPVDKCLECARKLHDSFEESMKTHGDSITLSVGIGIGHFMENLEDLLEYGRDAEKAAKKVKEGDKEKDALAIHVHKRGGAPIEIASRWQADPKPDDHLRNMAELINGKHLSGRVAYELRQMAKLYEEWKEPQAAIQRDVKRLLAKKRPGEGKKLSEGDKDAVDVLVEKRVVDSKSLDAFARELLVAKLIAEVMRQAEPKKEGAK